MSEIREFVLQEPLFDNHEHQGGFAGIEQRADEMTYREFVGYAGADLTAARGVGEGPDLSTDEGFFGLWQYVRTTGYGRATEDACAAVFDMEFSLENADRITDALRGFVSERGPQKTHEDLFDRAGIRWVMNDCCWDSPTDLSAFKGQNHPEFFRQALRYDALLMLSNADQVRRLAGALDRSMRTLAEFDQALDDYTERAAAGGRLAAMKCGLPYQRRLDFENSSFADAERVFEDIMQEREGDRKPLHDYLLHRFVRRARDFDLPVQFHTGYLAGNRGDPSRGDPTPLIPVFRRYRNVRFDMFHAGWPYCEVAGTIGKSFPNVWLDMCWAWTMNPAHMERVLESWLAAVPHNKILGFGGDTGSPFATIGYAVQARRGIANVLERKVQSGEYDLETARRVARRILSQNSLDLHRMG